MSHSLQDIALKLIKAEKEDEVDEIINKYSEFKNPENWQNYGGLENNFGTIGNQQSDSTAALVEKIVNSIDAVLICEAKRRRIDPKGPSAPQSMEKAVEQFFGIENGNIGNLLTKEQRELAQKIKLIATGLKTNPSYIIYDEGEGQQPDDFADTFLSLHKANKNEVPFVQGRFNMGGTGALPFCGTKNYQFLLSKKHPELVNDEENLWGFTLVRRRRPKEGEKSSVYEYFAPDGKVLRLKADKLKILPDEEPGKYNQEIKHGTLIKLYEYDITEQTLATFDLYYSLNRRLFKIPIPVRIIDNRDYKGTNKITLKGMAVRIGTHRNRQEFIEEEFPVDETIKIEGLGKARVKTWLFKEGKAENWIKPSEAIILTINGQAHATFDRRFFTRKATGKRTWIKDSLLMHVDCSEFPPDIKEDLFMGSRDRMRRGKKLGNRIEKELEQLIKKDETLKKWNSRRREEKMNDVIEEQEENTRDVFEELVNNNPEIASIFGAGNSLANPYKMGATEDVFEGKRFPTYLKLINPNDGIKECPENKYCRVVLETNAENEFFSRVNDPGELRVKPNEILKSSKLRNGRLTLTLEPGFMGLQEGDTKEVKVTVDSFGAVDLLQQEFELVVTPPQKKKNDNSNGDNKDQVENLQLPDVYLLSKEQWEDNWPGEWREELAVDIKEAEENIDIFVNEDNVNLQRILKREEPDELEVKLLKQKFKIAMGIVGFSIYSEFEDSEEEEEVLFKTTKSISQIILPLLKSLVEFEG